MSDAYFDIKVSGFVIEDKSILIIKKEMEGIVKWILPGTSVKDGMTMDESIISEIKGCTGIETEIVKPLYISGLDIKDDHHMHVSYLLKKIEGGLKPPLDKMHPVKEVLFVNFYEIEKFGFSSDFKKLLINGLSLPDNFSGENLISKKRKS